MDLHGLEYIVEIANMHSISKAAEKLYITQSTLSQFLSKLENELGVKLFDRKRTEMSLTLAGKLYVDSCRHMLNEKKDLYNQLSDLNHSKFGSFTVGITPQWGAIAFSHIIGQFFALYPGISVKVREEIATPLTQLLHSGEIDMAIIPLKDNSPLPFKSNLLKAEELLLAIPRSHASNLPFHYTKGKDTLPFISINDLSHEPFIISQPQTTIRNLQDQCFEDAHISPKVILEINSHPASLNMVEEGLGSTFVPISCTSPSDSIIYAHSIPEVSWHVVVAFRKGLPLNQSELFFVRLLQDYFKTSSVEKNILK